MKNLKEMGKKSPLVLNVKALTYTWQEWEGT
jgi:hypothetical protein